MGSPDWSKIPFEKMPQWKKDELLTENKENIEEIKKSDFRCKVCGKVCKNKLGLASHLRIHNK